MNTGSNLRGQLLAIRPEPDIFRPENAYGDGYVEGFWDAVARYKGAISELLPAAGGESLSPNTTTQDEGVNAALVRKLRKLVDLNRVEEGGPYQGAAAQMCVEAMAEAADALEGR